MCTSPIRMPNKSNNPYSPKYIYVPCNRCLSCQKTKQDGMEYRAIKEHEYITNHGGKSYMITFTYDNEHLPKMRTFEAYGRIGNNSFGKQPALVYIPLEDNNGDEYIFEDRFYRYTEKPCHDKRDLQLFNKRLRDALKRKGYHVLISYLIVCEYGGDEEYIFHGEKRKGTKRPHYHAIYNLMPIAGSLPTDQQFLDIAFQSWNMCEKFCFKSLLIDNKVLSAIGYITKYITKQESNKEFASRCIDSDSGNSFQIYNRKTQTYEDCEESRVAPFSLVSKNFGSKHLLDLDICEITEKLNKKATILNQNGSVYQIPFPAYYKKKFLYQTTKLSKQLHFEVIQPISHNILQDEYLIDDDILFPYYEQQHTKTTMKDIPLQIAMQDKVKQIRSHYERMKAYWYHKVDKPFSIEFLNYGLLDYLLYKDMDMDIISGEINPNMDIVLLQNFYSVSFDDAIKYKNIIETFIAEYEKIQHKYTNDILLIQRDKARKRAAERKYINKYHAR